MDGLTMDGRTGSAARGVFLSSFLNADGAPLVYVVDCLGRRIKEEPLRGTPGSAASFAQAETLWLFLEIHDPLPPQAARQLGMSFRRGGLALVA